MTSSEATVLALLLSVAAVDLLAATERPSVEAQATESRTGTPCLRANLCDSTELWPTTFAALKQEASAIYSTAGVDVVWQHKCSAEESAALAREDVAKVYVLAEIPTPIVFRQRRFSKLPLMGYNLSEHDGSLSSVIYVSRQAVEKLLRVEDPKRLARALGRITAHELAHRFLQSRHTSAGILRAEVEHADWLDDDPSDLYFTDDQTTTLQSLAKPCAPEPE